MRITHVTWGHYPQWKGCGPVIYLHYLALEQVKAGHEVAIVCASERTIEGAPAYATMTEVVEGIPYIHLCNRPVQMHDFWNPLREAHDPQCEEAVAAAVADTRADVVHIHNFVGLSFDVVAAARMAGAKVVNSLHNYLPVCPRDDLFFADAERCGGPLERSCSRCLGTLIGDDPYRRRHAAALEALNACDMNLAVSTRVAEIYEEQGVAREKLVVDRIGTTTGERLWRRIGAPRVARAAAGEERPGDKLELVFFGNVSLARKGGMVFLQALKQLKHPERVNARLFGGIGDQRDHINGFLATCSEQVRGAISFHNGFTQDDLDVILSGSDAAVLTPRWEDNGPQTVFEALAAGLPVIGTRVGGIPDVVHDGVNGVLVAEGDTAALAAAIDELSGDRARLAELRAGLQPPLSMATHQRTVEQIYARAGVQQDTPTGDRVTHRVTTAGDVVAALAEAVTADSRAETVIVDAGSDEDAGRLLAATTGRIRLEREAPESIPAAAPQPHVVPWSGSEIPDLHGRLSWASLAPLIDTSLSTLEVGCGDGARTRLLAGRIADLQACELDRVALQRGIDAMTALGKPGIMRFGDPCDLPYEDGRFEQVLISGVLEHLADHERAVRELARVLRPGGRLVVNGPLPGYDALFPQEFTEQLGNVRDGYTRDDMIALLGPLFELEGWSENSRAADVLGAHYLAPEGRVLEIDAMRAQMLEDDPASATYGFSLLARRTAVPVADALAGAAR